MMTSPKLLSRLWLVSCAGIALLATLGCQRKEVPAVDTATDAKPAASVPATAPTPAADEVPAGVLRVYVWHCVDGQTLVMRNLVREQAIAIDFHDGTRRLDQTVSASGARYADSVVVFWTKGSTATLERQGASPVQCEERRADSLREDARARGVVYRALGNEPGWVLEAGPAGRLSWTAISARTASTSSRPRQPSRRTGRPFTRRSRVRSRSGPQSRPSAAWTMATSNSTTS